MKNQLISLLKRNKITEPEQVDRLLISTFILMNKIKVKNNAFILQYIISSESKYENEILNELLNIVENELGNFGFEEFIKLFEFVISPSDRIINGAVYTPFKIREFITKSSFEHLNTNANFSIADISCGCGGFLFTACNLIKILTNKSYYFIFKYNIYGIDIQEYSVIRTKILLTLLAISNGEDRKEFTFNIYTGDSLSFDWKHHIKSFAGFNSIIGNPPYVCSRNLSITTKTLLKDWSVCSSGNPDLYIPFFQIGLENLSKDGVLGYITMNSFFKSLNGRALREYFHKNNISLKIIDFGSEQIFESKNTYTCICFLSMSKVGSIDYIHLNSKTMTSDSLLFEKINYEHLNHKKGWNLRSNKIMEKIESTGKPFGEIYKTRHGLATLKNSVYIFRPTHHDEQYYYIITDDNKTHKIEKDICRDVINSNKLSSNYSLAELTEKIIFPYNDEENPQIIPEKEMIKYFPFTYSYLSIKKDILSHRDKGNNKDYPSWYAFGRTQSLQKIKNKLFLPKISKSSPYSIISSDENLMFYNGIAIVGHSLNELIFIQKIINSRLFWYYITNTSKPYSSDYFSLNGNYINNFGVYQFPANEINYIISEKDKNKLDIFIENKYGVKVP
ncbi:Eco57I restriction-modification methylase domain-containing protein [Pectobacterium peruviense]|uniref:Eco57I restriction-modification methylase domain-containing protein n=1 Tax=Pectobacterium peruviense TaxID=2066479 RepID=UPI000DE352B0|nr:N-6 DNA methylase [Pectobacterium peruviense]